MRWSSRGRSPDVEDRRGQSGGFGMRRAAPIGLGGLAVLVILSLVTGQDFLSVVAPGPGESVNVPTDGPISTSPEEERLYDFVSFVLDDAQDVWERTLGGRYERATLVVFRDATESPCGFAESATGPFYCPGDAKVYIDLGFYDELRSRFGAGGDFAQAYVLAHEIGHHVQRVVGTESRVRELQRANPGAVNELSVRLELQADCYAGLWAHSTAQRQLLESGDVEEGLAAAAAVGDDRIQRMGGGRVAPERFTHGSSAQRMEWFQRGYRTGQVDSCNTFN